MRSWRVDGRYRARLKQFMLLCVLLLGILAGRVAYIQTVNGGYLQKLAGELHNRERTLEAKRGKILDRNGTVLAANRSVCRVSVVHNQIQDEEEAARVLAAELGLDYEETLAKVRKKVALQIIKNQVEPETAARIREYGLAGIIIDENYRRQYPYGTLAAQTLGFVGADNQGVVGLEVKYDEYLQGIDGRILSLTDARGVPLEGQGEVLEEATDGNTLLTTLDVRMQEYAEQLIEKAVTQKNAKKGALIAMDPYSGEIYAMAIYPSYDLNEPYTIQDETLAQQWDSFTEAEQMDYLNGMWRNYCINDTYEPGSTFKIITATAALSEGKVSLTDTFHCSGGLVVADRRIRCHKTTGHGTLTFVQGVQQSCNPVFMTLAARLGAQTFYDYLHLFEFDKKTGIDIPGEASGILHPVEKVGPVELATMGFGQSLTITPLQLLRAAAAVVNGGDLVTPHFGKEILDPEGNCLKELEYKTQKNVISREVSDTMRKILESVVTEGGGSRASVAGYTVGGKTATSQKLPRSAHKYISSFLGFSPTENPRLIVLCLVDEPEGIYYGGTVCAPIVSEFLANALPYLGVEPTADGEEEAGLQTEAPAVVGHSYGEAVKIAKEAGLTIQALGTGQAVTEQYPPAGEPIHRGTQLIIYLGEKGTKEEP